MAPTRILGRALSVRRRQRVDLSQASRGATIFLAAALVAACDQRPVRFETRLRALEGVEATAAPAVAQIELESPQTDSLRVEDIEASGELRRAFVARESLTMRWSLRPGRGASLGFALTSQPDSTPLTYRVRGGAPGALRDLRTRTPPGTLPWVETRVGLTGADGSPYVVEITVDAPGGRAAIAEPVLLGGLATPRRALEGVEVTAPPAVAQIELDSPQTDSLRVEDIEMGGDVRRAFVARNALTVRWSLRPPKGASLEFALTSKPHFRPLTYRVRGGPPGALRDLRSGAPPGTLPWVETRVALEGADGSSYVVEITAEAAGGRAVIAEPALLGPGSGAKPNVLVYVVDCLRADRVGALGSTRGLSPAIDEFAREGVVLEQAWSCASWTKPSVACMLTGRYPPGHGARTASDRLADGVSTLAGAFAHGGYATRAVVANPVLDAEHFGFGRGFRSYRNLARRYAGRSVNVVPADARIISDDAIAWLPSVAGRPFFLYLHSLDLHFPYKARAVPGRAQTSEGASEADLYDSEVAYNDHEIGRLFMALRQQGRLEDTIVVLTADHGEEFGEHGTSRHGHTLYQDLIHVPLIVRLPGGDGAGTRIPEPVSLVDLPETLLALAGLPP